MPKTKPAPKTFPEDEATFVTLPDLAAHPGISDRLYRLLMQWLTAFRGDWYKSDFCERIPRSDYEDWGLQFVPPVTTRVLNGLLREAVVAGLLIVIHAGGEVTLKRGPILEDHARALTRPRSAA